MTLLTITELLRLTRIELLTLLRRTTEALVNFAEGSAERHNALVNIRTIHRVLWHRSLVQPPHP